MSALAEALSDAGGAAAEQGRTGRLRELLTAELKRSARELSEPRSGYPIPVTVAIARPANGSSLVGVVAVSPTLRADPSVASERAWLLVAALVGALVEGGATKHLTVGAAGDALALRSFAAPGARTPDAELAALSFEEQVAGVDRLRAEAVVVPAGILDHVGDFRAPIGAAHPLLVALRVAVLGGRPADPRSLDEHEDAVLASVAAAPARPHDDPDPARRVARRILQRLDGMGKWGGYHTEFSHLSRGFAPADRGLAARVGEALLKAGLLREKPSVGQRHVFLDPRRAADVHAAIERGELPEDLVLPRP